MTIAAIIDHTHHSVLRDFSALRKGEPRAIDTGRVLASGSPEAVRAAAGLLVPEYEVAACISPSGRIDGHGDYVEVVDGRSVCAFCRRRVGK